MSEVKFAKVSERTALPLQNKTVKSSFWNPVWMSKVIYLLKFYPVRDPFCSKFNRVSNCSVRLTHCVTFTSWKLTCMSEVIFANNWMVFSVETLTVKSNVSEWSYIFPKVNKWPLLQKSELINSLNVIQFVKSCVKGWSYIFSFYISN